MRVVKKEVKIDNTKKVLYYEQFQDFNEYQKIVENRMKEKNCYKASFDKTCLTKGLEKDTLRMIQDSLKENEYKDILGALI